MHTPTTLLLIAASALAAGCSSTPPELGLTADGSLSPCPTSPNCVSSDATDEEHGIAPLAISGEPEAAWQAVIAAVEARPRFMVIEKTGDYLRAEARTRILRFVDDVEFHLRADERQIAMRSASRLGYSDLGANRRRLEAIREDLAAQGLVGAK